MFKGFIGVIGQQLRSVILVRIPYIRLLLAIFTRLERSSKCYSVFTELLDMSGNSVTVISVMTELPDNTEDRMF